MDDATALELQRLYFVAGANGDAAALSILTRTALHCAGNSIPSREALAGAEMLARLAAVNGGDQGVELLATVLLCRYSDLAADDPERATSLRWEAIELLEQLAKHELAATCLVSELSAMADEGDERAAEKLNEWIAVLPPNVAKAARDLETKVAA